MLEEKDLKAIGGLMDQKLTAMEDHMDQKLDQTRQDLTHQMTVLLDAEVAPKFALLAENQQAILEKLERLDDMEVMVKKLARDLEKLKRAQ